MIPTSVIRKALQTSLFVGTVLTMINQWEAVVGNQPFRVIPLILTYLVPLCVYCWGWWSNKQTTED